MVEYAALKAAFEQQESALRNLEREFEATRKELDETRTEKLTESAKFTAKVKKND